MDRWNGMNDTCNVEYEMSYMDWNDHESNDTK